MQMYELLPATLDSVAVARRAVRHFARDLEVDVEGIALAVSEAVTNAVAYAYVEDRPGIVELSASASPLEVLVTVRDHGNGLTGAGSGGAGYGLLIIRRLAQHVELDDTADGVALTMGFRRGGAPSAS